jgi:peptidoglycan/LPS O-acetylase OafA/YrhL
VNDLSTHETSAPPSRIPELDGIRGLAALGVVLFHAFPHQIYWGWSFVDLFFVLSGYLITTIILRGDESTTFLTSFYKRRILRIWPVYFLTLIAVVLLNAVSPRGYPMDGFWWNLFFVQNTSLYFGQEPALFIEAFSPSWSVAIEEQFYLVWPVLILLLGKTRVPLLLAAFATSIVLVRYFIPQSIALLFTRGDGLFWGCLLAWLLWYQTRGTFMRGIEWSLSLAWIVGSAFVAAYLWKFAGQPNPQWGTTAFTGFSLLFFALIGSCVIHSGDARWAILRSPLLRWLGTVSYGMYMFHLPIFHYVPAILGCFGVGNRLVIITTTWSLIFLLPAISWSCLERWILQGRQSRAFVASVGSRSLS